MDRVIQKKKWPLRKIIFIILCCLFVIGLIYLIFFREHLGTLNVDKSTIKTGIVSKGNFTEYIFVEGTVLPLNSVIIDATQGGKVEKIYAEDGAVVKKNDVLVKLSNRALELDYMNRETHMYDIINNLQNTKLNLEKEKFYKEKEVVELSYKIDKLKKDFEIKQVLYKDGLIAMQEYEDCKREYDMLLKQKNIAVRQQKYDSAFNIMQIAQIKSSIERMNKNLELLKENLDNLYIKAPIDGMLTGFNLELGGTKNSGETIGQIDVLDGVKIKARIDEFYLPKIFKGQDGECLVQKEKYKLKISKINSKIASGLCEIELLFTEKIPDGLKKGQSLRVQINLSQPSESLFIPRGNFFQVTSGNWIMVIDPEVTQARKRAIKTGRQNAESYEILEGLKEGEKVIIGNYDEYENIKKIIFE